MKKNVLAVILLLAGTCLAAGADLTAPERMTCTPKIGILLNITEGMLAATGSTAGISGFSFRYMDSNKNGFEIPFYLVFSTGSTPPGNLIKTSLTVGTGYLFINPLLFNEHIRINILSGFNARYYTTFNFGKRAPTAPVQLDNITTDSTVPPALPGNPPYSFGLTAGLEVEIPVGGIFSLPPDTICLAGGISATASGGFNISYSGGKLYVSSLAFSLGTSSYGSSPGSLGLRYYF